MLCETSLPDNANFLTPQRVTVCDHAIKKLANGIGKVDVALATHVRRVFLFFEEGDDSSRAPWLSAPAHHQTVVEHCKELGCDRGRQALE